MKVKFFPGLLKYYLVFGIVVPVLYYFLAIPYFTRQYDKIAIDDLTHHLTILQDVFQEDFRSNETQQLVHDTNFYASLLDLRITICLPDGKILTDSVKPIAEMENHANRPEIVEALSSDIGVAIRQSKTLNQKMIYVAKVLKNGQSPIAVIRLSVSTDVINHQLSIFNRVMLIYLLVFLLSLLAIIQIQIRKINRPLEQIMDSLDSLGKGDYRALPTSTNHNEFTILIDKLNLFAEKIAEDSKIIGNQKIEIKTILGAIQDIIWIQSEDEVILLSNVHFDETFSYIPDSESFVWEVIHDADLVNLIRSIIKAETIEPQQVTIASKSYILTGSPIPDRNVFVFLLRDITQWIMTEQIKKDFILNLAHELRTPLTLIRGYTETIEETVNDESKQYVQIIQKNIMRLNRLVEDLQSLSLLEQKARLFTERINLQLFLDNTREIYQNQLKESEIELIVDIPPDLPDIIVDPCRLEQVFINLIDNALRYTQKGSIQIQAKELDRQIQIEVTDTGMGIPQEHLARIFERFYVVDQSRNRKTSGTGLGLAIVKHIIQLHHGTIHVESKVNQGTKFIIQLPIDQG